MSARLKQTLRRVAWLEAVLTALAYTTLVLGALSGVASIYLLVHIGDVERGFPAGPGFITTIKGYGIGLFAVAAIVCIYVGRWLLELRVPEARRDAAARYEAVRLATQLAGEEDFQKAGGWEWRRQVAGELIPELKEYLDSDDWAERHRGEGIIKEAWVIHTRRSAG